MPTIDLFPPGALASSVITTVWVGVFVVAFFNLRLGWVLSGLVVPGYLAPLVLLKPWSAMVVIIEGMAAYLLVWLLSQQGARLGGWSSLFGRDRFFALILASIAVRLLFDGWLLPQVGAWIASNWVQGFDYRGNLHSFGLVVIALVANQFWKTGLVRGLGALLVTLAITVLVVRYGLMALTNFNLGALSYLYEDLATSILASPKAYIVLVTTAFVASRMNLYYGWDFSGILIPALLALQWYDPLKILTSFAEAFLILTLASLVLRAPALRQRSIEGAHKLLVFFNIAFLYKLMLGWALAQWAPALKSTDFFAFGYLLSTLLALKMHDKGIAVRMTRATLQVSLSATLVASVLGFGLTLWPESRPEPGQGRAPLAALSTSTQSVRERLLADKPDLYRARLIEGVAPLRWQTERFTQALRLLTATPPAPEDVALARGVLMELGYGVELLQERYLYLYEVPLNRGWGRFVIDTRPASTLVLELPLPLDSPMVFAGSLALFETLEARALALGGNLGPRGPLLEPDAFFQAFHRVFERDDVLQLSVSDEGAQGVARTEPRLAQQRSALWIKRDLPPGVSLVFLERLVGELELHWEAPALRSMQWRATRRGFAELHLSETAQQQLLIAPLLGRSTGDSGSTLPVPAVAHHAAALGDWLLESFSPARQSWHAHYQRPSAEQRLYFDREVITPLHHLIGRGYRDGHWSAQARQHLRTIDAAARVIGYQVLEFSQPATDSNYLLLCELDNAPEPHHWGLYVLRLGAAVPFALQVPRPFYEFSTLEAGIALFERTQARALLIAGADPGVSVQPGADVTDAEGQHNLFNLVSQVLMRETDPLPQLTVQIRALGERPGVALPEAEMLLAFADGTHHPRSMTPLAARLIRQLDEDDWRWAFVDGSGTTAPYQSAALLQARYRAATHNQEFVALWLSPIARSSYSQGSAEPGQAAEFDILGIPGELARLDVRVREALGERAPEQQPLPEAFVPELLAYLDTGDIVRLAAIMQRWPALRIERLVDRETRRAFMLVFWHEQIAGVAALNPRHPRERLAHPAAALDQAVIAQFRARGAAWLEIQR